MHVIICKEVGTRRSCMCTVGEHLASGRWQEYKIDGMPLCTALPHPAGCSCKVCEYPVDQGRTSVLACSGLHNALLSCPPCCC